MLQRKIRELLKPEDIAELEKRPIGAIDPLDMTLEEYVTAYRTKQRLFLSATPNGEGLTSDEIGAHNWFGNAARMLDLPRDEKQMWAMPDENWKPPVDPRTLGEVNYEAYCTALGLRLPDFTALLDDDKAAWEAAAKAVLAVHPVEE